MNNLDKATQQVEKRTKEHVSSYVDKWIESQEPDMFVKNSFGSIIYSAGHSSLNLKTVFESLLEDYIEEHSI